MGTPPLLRLIPLLLGAWACSASGFTINDLSPNPNAPSTQDTDSTPAVAAPVQTTPLFVTRTKKQSTATDKPTEAKPAPPPVIVIRPRQPLPVSDKPGMPKAKDKLLPLEVVVNGAKSGTWLLLDRGGVMYAPRDAFEEWRVQLAPSAQPIDFKFDNQTYWPLSAVPGYKLKLDFATQTADLQFSPEAFAATRMAQDQSDRITLSPVLPSAFLNYDISYSSAASRNTATVNDLGMLGEIGGSNAWGVLTSSFTGRNLTNNVAASTPRNTVRLETTLTRDFLKTNRTLRIGDAATRAGTWGRNVYFGGIQFGTNFALTPGFVSKPIPALVGVSTAPSTVQMYVNDVLRQVSSVPTGPFVINDFPLLSNSGDVKMVVRDILGRETVIEQSFFTSTDLLAAGLSDWSVEAGKVRRNMGLVSNSYGAGFLGGTWRRGYSDDLTLEGRAEMGRIQQTLGVGTVSALPGLLLGQASLAASHANGQRGALWLLGLERERPHNSLSFQAQGATRNFRQLGQDLTTAPVKLQLAGNWSHITEDNAKSFGMGLATLNRFDDTRVTTLSGNYSAHIGERSNLSITASRAIMGTEGTSIGVFFTMPLDNNRIVSTSVNTHGGTHDIYASAIQNPTNDSNLGWRALAGHQDSKARLEGGVSYLGRYGKVSGDVSGSPNQTAWRANANGGLVFADNNLFATQRVDQSFALAEVGNYRNIGIGLGSNTLTHTNAHGVALIPRLIPFQSNAIRLDPSDLPISAEIDSIEQSATPAWRSAVKVVFPVRGGRAALLKITLDDGDVAPPGATVKIANTEQEFYVARRGEVFVTGLSPANTIVLNWNGQQCKIDVALPPEAPEEIARLGPLQCKGVAR